MRAVVWRLKGIRTMRDCSRGQLLIEVLIALALLGITATVFIAAMYTALHSAGITDERSIAVTLAASEIEYVKQMGYSTTAGDWAYTVDSTGSYADPGPEPSWWGAFQPPALSGDDFRGYSVAMTGVNLDLDNDPDTDDNIRTITATVLHNGTPILTLMNYELNR